MAGVSRQRWFEADELRRLIPVFALAVAVVAALADPSSAADLAFVAVPVVAFSVWAHVPACRSAQLAVAVVVPVVLAQRSDCSSR